MIVAFPFSFLGKIRDDEEETARLFIENTRRFSNIQIVQISDMNTRKMEGVDDVFRIERDADFGCWYYKACLNFPADKYLRLDYDCMLLEDVSGVFDGPYDIAIAKEDKNSVMNNGVVFVNNKAIFAEALNAYIYRTKMDGWNDLQISMQIAIDEGKYRVRKLPIAYNYVWQVPFTVKPKILHFKGVKKRNIKDELGKAIGTLERPTH